MSQITRPSGLRQSENGKYVYASCVVTGKPTFFKPDYFAQVLARDFGGDEVKMFKGYVCKEVKNLRKQGKKDDEIKKMLGSVEKAPKKAKKHPEQIKADKVLKVKRVKKNKTATTAVGVEVVSIGETVSGSIVPVEVTRPVYPWTNDPNYFRSPIQGSINMAEASRVTCFHPGIHLDDLCQGCPIFNVCTCTSKVNEEERKKEMKKGYTNKPVIRALPLLDGCFDKPEVKA